MTTILTDADGNRYEVHATMPVLDVKYLVIKPVQPEEEKQGWLRIEVMHDDGTDFHDGATNLTKDLPSKLMTRSQAELFADAVRQLFEYVTDQPRTENSYFAEVSVVVKARQALQGKKVG